MSAMRRQRSKWRSTDGFLDDVGWAVRVGAQHTRMMLLCRILRRQGRAPFVWLVSGILDMTGRRHVNRTEMRERMAAYPLLFCRNAARSLDWASREPTSLL